MQNLQELTDRFQNYGTAPALISFGPNDSKTVLTYHELATTARQLADGLRRQGLKPGDRVAIFAGNSPDWILTCFAILHAGGTVVPIDAQYADTALAHVLADSAPSFLFAAPDEAERIRNLSPDLADVPLWLLNADATLPRHWRNMLADASAAATATEEAEETAVTGDSIAVIFYTSGTTGRPKGVPLTHDNLIFQIHATRTTGLVREDDRLLLPLPLHHVYPFDIGLVAALSLGVPVILPHALTGPGIVRALREGRATIMIGVPRLYRALIDAIESRMQRRRHAARLIFRILLASSIAVRRLTRRRWGRTLLKSLHAQMGPDLRIVASGGAALDQQLAWKMEGLGWQVIVGYGLTETSPLLTLDPPDASRIGSVGQVMPGIELKIAPTTQPPEAKESDGQKPADQDKGEVLARGPGVFHGYRNLPEETRQAFTEDGWFRTGDLGRFDDDRYLYVYGRISTLIVMEGGENVQPEEIEDAYEKAPLIRELAVFAKEHRLVAIIVPEMNEEEMQDRDRARQQINRELQEVGRKLPSYQRLAEFALTSDALPRTRLGKIRRHLLPDRFEQARRSDQGLKEKSQGTLPVAEMSDGDQALLDNNQARQAWEMLAQRYPQHYITPDTSPQLDLGIDSLEWVTLTMDMQQRIGLELTPDAIARVETIRDLMHEVAEASTKDWDADRDQIMTNPESQLNPQQKRHLQPIQGPAAILTLALYWLNYGLVHGFFRLQVEGQHALPDGPFVMAPNHTSYLDPMIIAAALSPKRLRKSFWVAWIGVAFSNWLLRAISRLAQAVPIDPNRGAISSLAVGAAILKKQHNLIWFPEGARSVDGQLKTLRPGLGILLENFPLPVVPVMIKGAHEAMPVGAFLPKPVPITITFGQPHHPEELIAPDAARPPTADAITAGLQEKLLQLGAEP